MAVNLIKRILFILLIILPEAGIATLSAQIKVACVGNSITYGAGIQSREANSYPKQLQDFLGPEYEVVNFGVSGRTALEKGDYPYVNTDRYKQSLAFNPDIVFIKFGTNDSKPQNRIYLDRFMDDYLKLIRSYRSLPSKPRIIILTPLRSFLLPGAGINDSVIQNRIVPELYGIAHSQDLEIINMYNLFGNEWREHLMPDRLHPSSIGASKMAEKLYKYLTVNATGKAIVPNFPLKPVREFDFHGYKGYVYDDKGVECYIVEPHQVAQGNPWVWRARFWGHEPQTDQELLERGFHLTYCDVADLFGSKEAVRRWNRFYKLVTNAGLSEKVVLEGMSRGGLIVYNWAAANPKKVACIYADAPVMDLKSWPMGELSGKRSETDTRRMLSAYGFKSEKEAMAYRKNPVDNAKRLAKANIPMLHVVGDADEVVPVAVNTALFAKRLLSYGYNLRIIHKPGVGHHPHSLNNPSPIVNFILKATGQYENMAVHPIRGCEYRSGAGWTEGTDWTKTAQDIQNTLTGKRLKLLLLGNSITQGFGGNRATVAHKPGKEAMDNALGKDCWEAAAISGDRTQHLLWRLTHDDYNRCQPENAVITIGINNLGEGDTPEEVTEGILAIVEEATTRLPQTRIFLFGPLPAGESSASDLRMNVTEIHRLLAKHAFGDVLYTNPADWFVNPDGSLKKELYSGDFIHLNKLGYEVWSKHIVGLINSK